VEEDALQDPIDASVTNRVRPMWIDISRLATIFDSMSPLVLLAGKSPNSNATNHDQRVPVDSIEKTDRKAANTDSATKKSELPQRLDPQVCFDLLQFGPSQ
jgi:hypothetical protein